MFFFFVGGQCKSFDNSVGWYSQTFCNLLIGVSGFICMERCSSPERSSPAN